MKKIFNILIIIILFLSMNLSVSSCAIAPEVKTEETEFTTEDEVTEETTEEPPPAEEEPPPPTKMFVGSKKSDVYHYPSCRYVKKILPENIIWFSSVEDARNHRYRPCKVCKPP